MKTDLDVDVYIHSERIEEKYKKREEKRKLMIC